MTPSGILTYEKVQEIKNQTVGVACKGKCGGKGVIFQNRQFIDCDCMNVFVTKLKIFNSNIPPAYHDFRWSDLTKAFQQKNEEALKIIKKYMEEIDKMISKGAGLFIQGPPGVAKTSLATLILKEAILKDYTGFFINMGDLVNLLINTINDPENSTYQFIKNADLLVIDEIDVDYRTDNTTFHGTLFNRFISYRYSMNKSLIVTSSKPRQNLPFLIDKLSPLIDIILVGTSHRVRSGDIKKVLEDD